MLIILQSIFGKYQNDVEKAWSWFLPTIMPTLSLIVGVLVSDAFSQDQATLKIDKFIYNISFGFSLVYLLMIYLVLFLQPLTQMTVFEVMHISNLWLGPFQGLVGASLTVFFVRRESE